MHETFQIGPKLCHFWKNTFPAYFGDLECISILLKHLLLNVLSVLVADQSREVSTSASLRCLPPAPSGKKVKTGGDDTFFICHSEKIVGMADGVGGWQRLELKLASMQGSSCHTINDYYLPEATRLCWSSTHYVMCKLKNEIPKFIHFMFSCTLIMYLAANLPLIFTYRVVWSIVYMLGSGHKVMPEILNRGDVIVAQTACLTTCTIMNWQK